MPLHLPSSHSPPLQEQLEEVTYTSVWHARLVTILYYAVEAFPLQMVYAELEA